MRLPYLLVTQYLVHTVTWTWVFVLTSIVTLSTQRPSLHKSYAFTPTNQSGLGVILEISDTYETKVLKLTKSSITTRIHNNFSLDPRSST